MKNRLWALLILSWAAFPLSSFAQTDTNLTEARMAAEGKDYSKAATLYTKAWDKAPGDGDIYGEYLTVLIAAKSYKEAEKLIATQQQYNNSPLLLIDQGRVYAADGKDKKAGEQYDNAVQRINGDDLLTQQMAGAFITAGREDYAVKAYERARDLMHNPYLYSGPLSRLYAKTGAVDKAVESLLDSGPYQMGGAEETKASLLDILGNDPKKLQVAQKTIIRRINIQPENVFYSELLTWLYSRKGDWEGALLQIGAIDERNKEGGQRLLEFARYASKEGQQDIAGKALDAVVEKGKEGPMYAVARSEKLNVGLQMLEDNPAFTKDQVADLVKGYEAFLGEFPQYPGTEVMRDYALVEAQYNNNPKKAIEILRKAIVQPNASRELIGREKLQLGDYLILDEKVWDASLIYSQVDKAFREDALGEEARFRNAKLAYYRGDFEWAQGQLSVLKASTSELIANDALYLSVLITENTPDSNTAPLLRFAHADLLLFQNKDAAAIMLLDSMAKAWPKHSLNDDILMLRANIAIRHRDYTAALGYLKQIMEQYGKDVLGDDAVFKTADIYERRLHDPEQARKYYEQLVIDYPGSTYVQTARQHLQMLTAADPAKKNL